MYVVYVRACMYVCVYANMCVCVCVREYACMHVMHTWGAGVGGGGAWGGGGWNCDLVCLAVFGIVIRMGTC